MTVIDIELSTGIERDAGEVLVRLARRDMAGHLHPHCDRCFAEELRVLAPAWRGLADEAVSVQFEQLKDAIELADGGWDHYSEVIPDATGADRDDQADIEACARLASLLEYLTTARAES